MEFDPIILMLDNLPLYIYYGKYQFRFDIFRQTGSMGIMYLLKTEKNGNVTTVASDWINPFLKDKKCDYLWVCDDIKDIPTFNKAVNECVNFLMKNNMIKV